MKTEHRNKTFEYTAEAAQDAESQWGIDLDKLGTAGIDLLLDQSVDFDTISITITKSDSSLNVVFNPLKN